MSYQPDDIKKLVREVVERTLGNIPTHSATNSSNILTAEMVQKLPIGSVYQVSSKTIITPLAQQTALDKKIRITTNNDHGTSHQKAAAFTPQLQTNTNSKVIAIGADHGGYTLKETLQKMLESQDFGYTLVDCGTHSTESVDYPDFAYAVARLVADGKAWRGIIIDGAGIGSCMTANKVPGVRAAMCYDQATAVNSREHNNANVLSLGAGLIGTDLAKQIVSTWLTTEFAGGRHARRVDKIDQLDKRFQR
jgi:ribose 5-phosphate isomerase B